ALPATPTDIVVNDTTNAPDVVPGDGNCGTAAGTCTLAAAIEEANAKAGPVIVHLPAAVFTFTSGPYPDSFEGSSALPHATGDLTIVGQGVGATVLRTQQPEFQSFRVLLAFGGKLTLEGLTLSGSSTSGFVDGGMIRAIGSPLTLRDVAVED